LKHQLKGDEARKIEIFIDNLPDGPDNFNLAPEESFWIALQQVYLQDFREITTENLNPK